MAPSSSGMPDNVGMIIARKLLQGNAQRRLPGSTGGTDRLESRATRSRVKIGLDDQHPAFMTDRPP
jgi:hypothetical protein